MIVDSHAHIFENWSGACGLASREEHWRYIQKNLTRPAAKIYRFADGAEGDASELFNAGDNSWAGLRDDVNFRIGPYGRIEFTVHGEGDIHGLTREQVTENLPESGLWTVLRTRPYSKVPSPQSTPHSIFVNAMDTNPLAAKPEVVLSEAEADFRNGLVLVTTVFQNQGTNRHQVGHVRYVAALADLGAVRLAGKDECVVETCGCGGHGRAIDLR